MLDKPEIIDHILILTPIRIFIIVAFIWGLMTWQKKTTSAAPRWAYWLAGLWFVFLQSNTVATTLFVFFYILNDDYTKDAEILNSMGSVFGLFIYIFIGYKYFRTRKELFN